MIKKINQNCGPEKPSKNDAPGISFGTQNRQEFMLLRPKIDKIAQQSGFLRRPFFDDFSGCQKPNFLIVFEPKNAKDAGMVLVFFLYFSSFSFVSVLSSILNDFLCPRRPKMSKNTMQKQA